jgi:hypothetical protein
MFSPIKHGRRHSPRAPIEVAAQVAVGLDRFPARVKQISEGGLKLESDLELPKARMVVQFDLPGFGEQRVVSEVCWAQNSKVRSYGCAFKDVPPAVQLNIATYVKTMKKRYTELQLAIALNRPRGQISLLLREAGLSHITDPAQLKDTITRAMEQLQSASN